MRKFLWFVFFIFGLFHLTSCQETDEEFAEVTKIALRDIGNKLLIVNKDSTSLILPVTKIESRKYQLKFQNHLAIDPDSLVSIVKSSFEIASLPKKYRIEVIQCDDNEVAYSFEIKNEKEKDIIPCGGRNLPSNCYNIQVRFIADSIPTAINYLSIVAITFLSFGFLYRIKKSKIDEVKTGLFAKIGDYEFYPEQNKLVYNDDEINLSKKECELLVILNENLNEVVKREELSKRIWEDHGVFVGRSLDTYVSKLRKKFEKDASIKITNIHSVGYKLEVI